MLITSLAFVFLCRQAAAAACDRGTDSHHYSEIQWASCGSDAPPSLECGQLKVPLDWSRPHGEKITLNMARVNATSSSTRIGTLIFNPGGPGGSAVQFCEAQAGGAPVFSDEITAHFDILCPDPRGIGLSNPISCDADLWNERPSLFPANEAAFEELVKHNKAFGESCIEKSGDIVKHVDTTSVVKDLEAIRVAIGEGKLNWMGISYGTQIGSQYAELYPENIRAMVLDGILDHSAPEIYTTATESETYESELRRFFDWCSQNETCPLEGDDLPQRFEELVQKAYEAPIAAPGCLESAKTASAGQCYPNVTGQDIVFNVQGNSLLTYKEDTLFGSGWEVLGLAINQTMNGNATLLSSPVAQDANATVWQGLAVGCLDWNHGTTTFAQHEYRQLLGNATSPLTRGACQSYTYNTQCIGWPAPMQNPQHVLNQKSMAKAPPILMVNSNHDPETSYVFAQSVRSQMPSAVLVTRIGDGHSSFGLKGEASKIMDEYLVHGKLPAQDTLVDS